MLEAACVREIFKGLGSGLWRYRWIKQPEEIWRDE